MRAALLAMVLALAGCFSPHISSGRYSCSDAAGCPPGFHCRAGLCVNRDGAVQKRQDARAEHGRGESGVRDVSRSERMRSGRDALSDACGPTTCPLAATCTAGACSCSGSTYCPSAPACVDVQDDPDNCGSCGAKCTGYAQACVSGACDCRPGFAKCGGSTMCTTDTEGDASNCGSCGNKCGIGAVCQAGICVLLACTGSYTSCGGDCVDESTDPTNCGSCGHACADDQLCIGGTCVGYYPATGCTACGSGSGSGCLACGSSSKCCNAASYGIVCVLGTACP